MKRKLFALLLALILLGGCSGGGESQNISGEELASPGGSDAPTVSSTARLEEKEYSFENPKPVAMSEPTAPYLTAEELTITDADMLSLRDQFYVALKEQLERSGLSNLDETRGNHGLAFSAMYSVNLDQKNEDNHYCDMVFQFFAYTTEREEPRLIYTYCDAAYADCSPIGSAMWFYEDYRKNGAVEGLDLCLRTLVEYRSHLKWVGGLMSSYVVKDDSDKDDSDKDDSDRSSITEAELAEQLQNERLPRQSSGHIFFDAEEVKDYSAIYGKRENP